MRTSMVSVLVLRVFSGRPALLLFDLLDVVRDTDVVRVGVRVGVLYGSPFPALTAGAGGAGFAGNPAQPPSPSFGVRSQRLLILGVTPPAWEGLFFTICVVEFGDGCAD